MFLLASASPARRRLLEQACIPHRVQVSGVDEEAIHHPNTEQLVQRLAQAKAEAVLAQLPDARNPASVLEATEAMKTSAVLGCDSVLSMDGDVYGKPVDADEACQRWRRMAGGWAELHTGHCLIRLSGASQPVDPPTDSCVSTPSVLAAAVQLATVTTRVKFACLNEAEIAAYVATGEPLRCAGGFALEGRGGLLVEQIQGCFSNVIGLSLPLLNNWLRRP